MMEDTPGPQAFDYLVAMFFGTTGATEGEATKEIAEIPWFVIDTSSGQTADSKKVCIKSATGAYSATTGTLVEGLKEALKEFDTYVYSNFTSNSKTFCILMDGAWHMECLINEAKAKGIQLEKYFSQYFDLRKEFTKAFPRSTQSTSLVSMMEYLEIPTANKDGSPADENCSMIVKIAERLLKEGHVFTTPEHIENGAADSQQLQGLSDHNPEDGYVVRLRGLPFQTNENDIVEFFNGCTIYPNPTEGIHFVLNFHGRPTGEAYVQFADEANMLKALQRDKQHMGHRYIEIFTSTKSEMEHAKGIASRSDFRRGDYVVRMRGLPYSAVAADIVQFFDGLDIANEGIHFVNHPDGRATGDAFVQFANAESARKAMMRHRGKIGGRYIELFRSSEAEMYPMMPPPQHHYHHGHHNQGGYQRNYYNNHYNNNYSNNSNYNNYNNGWSHPNQYGPPASMDMGFAGNDAGFMMGMGGFSEHVARLRGLPYSANEVDIAEFFSGLNIAHHGIHLVFNQQDRPTGEAFVEFVSAEDVNKAVQKHKQQMGHRYIEVFKSSRHEMMMACGGVAPSAMGGMPGDYQGMMDPNMYMMMQQQQQPHHHHGGGWGADQGYYGHHHPRGGGPMNYQGGGHRHYQPRHPYQPRGQQGYNKGSSIDNNNSTATTTTTTGPSATIRLRGLPYRARTADVVDFLQGYSFVENSIRFGSDRDGRPNGTAWVTMTSVEEAQRAFNELNAERRYMNGRYIEVFLQQ